MFETKYYTAKMNMSSSSRVQDEKPQTGKEYLQRHTCKDLLCKTHKEVFKLINEKTTNLIKKWAKDLNRHNIRQDIQKAK